MILDEGYLDDLAFVYEWTKLKIKTQTSVRLAAYKKDDMRLHFWLTTGTVGSYLNHPKQGKTQLFRRKISFDEAEEIFVDPRIHLSKGYHSKAVGVRIKEEITKEEPRSPELNRKRGRGRDDGDAVAEEDQMR